MDEVCLKDNYCDDGLPPLFLTKFILGILIIRWYSNDCRSIGVIRGQTTKQLYLRFIISLIDMIAFKWSFPQGQLC